MLKNSARNCIFTRSVITVSFISAKSTLVNPGPVTILRPEFPKVSGALMEKAEVLKNSATVCGPPFGSPLTFARSSPRAVLLWFSPVNTENGWPD